MKVGLKGIEANGENIAGEREVETLAEWDGGIAP